MSTPICDFVREYAKKNPARFHMPAHKGQALLGPEALDITEIDGADELFAPEGIIAQSEKYATEVFGAKTLYSAAGSTLCIQTMVLLVRYYASALGRTAKILAARNAHRAFINAAALTEVELEWLYPQGESYHASGITPAALDTRLEKSDVLPDAVYVTSPDYLGNLLDIKGLSAVCRKHGVLLLVDAAHGAYLKFLPESLHPADLGADICCTSAHKTLPVLTGGAYLHIADGAPKIFFEKAKSAMSVFASSSPSYLILQSLDLANSLFGKFRKALAEFLPRAEALKAQLSEFGYRLCGDEPLKITLCPKTIGYTGEEISSLLEEREIYPEFYDKDYVVLMLSPENSEEDMARLKAALCSACVRPALKETPPKPALPKRALSPREALLAPSEKLPLELCEGRIYAQTAISCPPAIPLLICGERIDGQTIECLKYYGTSECEVAI